MSAGKRSALLVAAVLALSAACLAQAPATAPSDANLPRLVAAPPGQSATGAAVEKADDPNKVIIERQQPSSPWSGQWLLFVMLGAIVLLMVFSGRTRRKQEAKRKDMLSSMKKGDRVTTIGGVIGTLIELRDNEVVIKVDEQNNVRMRFLRSAIHSVGEPPAEQKKETKA
jgi:preprotein translocase subunit YajC